MSYNWGLLVASAWDELIFNVVFFLAGIGTAALRHYYLAGGGHHHDRPK